MNITGKIHSLESCGTVDGPGIRFVVFCQGCKLRCQYCHNPDTWDTNIGTEITVENLFKEIKKYKSYMHFSNGGVTLSGGEPFLQPEFIKEVFKKCRQEGIHTALDTSGYVDILVAKDVLEYTDMVLLDIKSYNTTVYKNLTGVELASTLELASYMSKINKPVWIRYVLVPNITDDIDDVNNLAKFLSTMKNIERVDVLPFHKMGEFKWKELGYNYKLENIMPPDTKTIDIIKNIFQKYNLKIF